jgi:di/tricarboxylate transporter
MSASNNFITASNPSISMVTGPAGYSTRDMWRVGGPLTLGYTAIVVAMVNVLF